MNHTNAKAFTLAELLIALAILGVIATFTIPKIISAQADSRNKAVAKEVIATVSNALYLAKTNGVLSTTSTFDDLTPYMNYVAVDTSSDIDSLPTVGVASYSCVSPNKCLRLHNGALLLYPASVMVNITGAPVSLVIDPDGQMTSKQDSLAIYAYNNGKVVDVGAFTGNSNYTPAWFTW